MVGHAATELLVDAQRKTERTRCNPEMGGDANNTIEAAPELPAGAGCQEKNKTSLRRVKCFYLTSPFIEPPLGTFLNNRALFAGCRSIIYPELKPLPRFADGSFGIFERIPKDAVA